LLSTMNDLPGYQVVRVFGEVFGLTRAQPNMFSTMGAGFKAMAGGELRGLSKLLSDSRYEAPAVCRRRPWRAAPTRCSRCASTATEIASTPARSAAYGTAVYVIPEGAENLAHSNSNSNSNNNRSRVPAGAAAARPVPRRPQGGYPQQ